MTTLTPELFRSSAPRGDWEVTSLGRHSWRIGDRRRRVGDAECLVAYVERNSTGSLDALWLRTPCPRRTRYRDFEELLNALEDAVALASERAQRPNPIPSRPPL